MVFYFSGTGNSKHVAESLGDARVVNLSEAVNRKNYDFTLEKGEAVGIVCPVYYSGVPKTVLEFARHLVLHGEVTYFYEILTGAGGFGGAGWMLKHELAKRGYKLNSYFDVRMASNYIMFGPLKDIESEKQHLKAAEPLIRDIREHIEKREPMTPDWTRMDKFLTWTMYMLCDKYMSTKKFYGDERCTGCGLCVKRCPSECIEMVNGKPSWTKNKNKCVRCMGCMQCDSVQYGDKLKGRRRYSYSIKSIKD